MMKTLLSFLALAVLFDAIMFGGFYRDTTVGESVQLGHRVLMLDWNLTH